MTNAECLEGDRRLLAKVERWLRDDEHFLQTLPGIMLRTRAQLERNCAAYRVTIASLERSIVNTLLRIARGAP